MFEHLITFLLGAVSSAGITYIICRLIPQKKIIKLNEETLQEEQKQITALHNTKTTILHEIAEIEEQKKNAIENVNLLQQQAAQSAQIFYTQEMNLAKEKLDHALEKVALQYQADEEAYRNAYLETMKEYAKECKELLQETLTQRTTAEKQLNDLQQKVEIAVAAAKREEEKRNEKDFYRLVLPDSDLNEVQQLRQVEPFLKDKEALNKVIWKVYYEKPYSDLIGRVVGSKVKTGIYKITNTVNQMCYVGQAVNIADRWRQHIKRGIGAEPPTRNKLYPAMLTTGVHNFTFEIIEECDRSLLNEREDYWQDYFKAKEFGYSIK